MMQKSLKKLTYIIKILKRLLCSNREKKIRCFTFKTLYKMIKYQSKNRPEIF